VVRYFGKYLQGTKEEGIYLDPNDDKPFECWVDADFLGQYIKGAKDMALDAMTAKSRTGFIITYAGCSITWSSKVQRDAALSSTESEYIAMSEVFRVLLPMMDLVARLPKMRPRTWHINVKYHHFREAVTKGRIKVQQVFTHEQLGDALTKNLPRDLFTTLRKQYMGW
jgi:hypothetical protein